MATTKNRVGGTVFLSVNGERMALVGNVKVGGFSPMREAQNGPVETNGFIEKARTPFIECELSYRADLDLVRHANIDEATVAAELANGHLAVLSDAWAAGDWDFENEEGKITARWEGRRITID